jgi:SanA protein
MKRSKKKFLKVTIAFIFLCLLALYFSNKWVVNNAKDNLFSNVTTTPKNKVGLVLGTSKYLKHGTLNLFYKYRVTAAIQLFKAGKIEYIIVSGDNSREGYDEPTDMMRDLIAAGIPKDKIFRDYAGFRTLDSVVRSKEIFGQERVTIISQQFHNERALYIAEKKGINAIGFNAQDVPKSLGRSVYQREYFARVKMMLDLILHKNPKYLGEKITIN